MVIVDDLVVGLGCYKTGCNEVAKLPVLESGNKSGCELHAVAVLRRPNTGSGRTFGAWYLN